MKKRENQIMVIIESLILLVGKIMATFNIGDLPQGCTFPTLSEERRRVLNWNSSIVIIRLGGKKNLGDAVGHAGTRLSAVGRQLSVRMK